MRFISHGPSLPDDLLIAQDAGDVLFFCGAGVSYAQAKLPGFVALASTVLDSLGSSVASPARRLFEISRKLEDEMQVTGLVATDRIFGLLEREFDPRDVRAAVAAALRPRQHVDLSAHRTLLALSTTQTGATRLVTTNFDLLFEDCEEQLKRFSPPSLPDPLRERDFRGVVHLHGCVDTTYRQALDDELVLSSADFGHAYLSDGWAARYIQKLLQRFTIVFVGYSADDPPVQYLLEALNRYSRPRNPLYAFQAGAAEQALAQWAHKGVVPLPFDASNNYEALWLTLGAWAERTSDPEKWHKTTLAMAKEGPMALTAVERGQFVHMAGTELGANLLALAQDPPPADWLITLDPEVRAYQVTRVGGRESTEDEEPFVDFEPDDDAPSDLLPTALTPGTRRPLEEGHGKGLIARPESGASAPECIYLKGMQSTQPFPLSARLLRISEWLAKVSPQPAALWWASRQSALHPQARDLIERQLRYYRSLFAPEVLKGWKLLMRTWQQSPSQPHDRYEVQREVDADGWTPTLVRRAVEIYRPMLEIQRYKADRLPKAQQDDDSEPIVAFDVEYPRPPEPFDFPDAMLPYALEQLRQQLQLAVDLENEISSTSSLFFDTLRNDDDSPLDEDGYGLQGPLATFVNLMRKLMTMDVTAAQSEVVAWSGRSDALFTHLRIWSTGQRSLYSADDAALYVTNLAATAFWESQHERDLLISLRDRWSEFAQERRLAIEHRLCLEPHPYEGVEDGAAIVAHRRLDRLQWLARHGAEFSAELPQHLERLQLAAPDWTDQSLDAVAEPRFGRVYSITTDSSPNQLLELPLGRILEEDMQAQQRDVWAKVQKHPFRGLAQERIRRAICALTDATRKGHFLEQPWNVVLQSTDARASNDRVVLVLAQRLSGLAPEQLAQIAHYASQWLVHRCQQLASTHPHVLEKLWSAMVAALLLDGTAVESTPRLWVRDASNRPSGRLVDVVFLIHPLVGLAPGQGLHESTKSRLQQLLDLPPARRPFTVAAVARRLPFLYQVDPEWTTAYLLPFARTSGPDGEAFWSGFSSSSQLPTSALFDALRPQLTSLPASEVRERSLTQMLAATLLDQWLREAQDGAASSLSDQQLREVLIQARNSFRVQVLQQLRVWVPKYDAKGDNIVKFLHKVWPRQRTARTPGASQELIELAMAVPSRYAEIMDLVLGAIVPIADPCHIGLPEEAGLHLAGAHPTTMLSMLSASLEGHRINHVPWIPALLRRLRLAPETSRDPKLADLMRRAQVA